jgi:hypothetical protein
MLRMNEQKIIKKSNNVKQGAIREATMLSKEYQEEQQHCARNSKKNNIVKQGITIRVVALNKE